MERREGVIENHKEFVTNDLSFAAYLIMHSMTLIDARKLGRSFKFTFINCVEIERLKFSYPGSESSRHDDAVRKLKTILFSEA